MTDEAATPLRLRLTLAYDGTAFAGFQRQAQGRTVQATLEAALASLTPDGRVVAAGRTDAGVHATGQVVHCDYAGRVPLGRLGDVLNARLPPDVAVQDCRAAPPDFHARYSALSRTYQYRLFQAAQRQPLRERHAWRLDTSLALPPLTEALGLLRGCHSFRHFGEIPGRHNDRPVSAISERGWRRDIYRAELQVEDSELTVTIEADAFLTHMMRALVGALVAIGRQRLDPAALAAALADETSNAAVAPVAPPHGLCLVAVRYPDQS